MIFTYRSVVLLLSTFSPRWTSWVHIYFLIIACCLHCLWRCYYVDDGNNRNNVYLVFVYIAIIIDCLHEPTTTRTVILSSQRTTNHPASQPATCMYMHRRVTETDRGNICTVTPKRTSWWWWWCCWCSPLCSRTTAVAAVGDAVRGWASHNDYSRQTSSSHQSYDYYNARRQEEGKAYVFIYIFYMKGPLWRG